MKLHFLLPAIFLSSVISAKSPATVPNNDTIKLRQIDEITVVGLSSNALSLPYIQIPKSQIESKSFFSPADALKHEAGIALYRDGIWATSINVRGISEQRLLLLVDEDRIQTATDIAGALSTVDINSFQRIEVIKGAASVLYGSGAMGGVVNFVSERPTYSSYMKTSGNVAGCFNTVNNLWSSNAKIDVTNRDWYLTFNGSYRTAQNTTTPSGILNNSQFNDASWGVRGGMKYGDKQELLVNYNHFEAWNVGLPGSNVFPQTSIVKYKNISRNQLSGEYIFSDLSDYLTELRIKAYTQNISRDVENKVNSGTLILPSGLNRTSGVKATSDWYFNDYNTLKIGAETWLRKSETARVRLIYAADTTVIGDMPTPTASMLDIGAFAHYKLLIDPRYWTLNAGFRLDYIQTANDTAFKEIYKYKIINGERKNLTYNHSVLFSPSTDHELSYSAHIDIEHSPNNRHKFIASLANAYRAASIEERYKYIDQAGTLRVGNPALKPEKGYFTNLSYAFTTNKIRIKVDFFANYMFDLITEKTGSFTLSNGTSVAALLNTNINKAFFIGSEIDLKWLISKGFWLNATTSYTRARDVEANTFLLQIPPLHGELTFNYRYDKKFELSFSSLFAATQNEVATGEPPTTGHIVFDTNIHTLPILINSSYLQVFAGVDNVLNTAYYNHLSTTRGINRLEPGRNIFVKAQLGW